MCLELIFQRELDDPWCDRRCLNYTEGRRRRASVAGIPKVRMVEDVEEFCAEFHVAGIADLRQSEALLQIHVEVRLSRTSEDISANISKTAAVPN